MEHRGCVVCGRTTVRTGWHWTRDAQGEHRIHDACDPEFDAKLTDWFA